MFRKFFLKRLKKYILITLLPMIAVCLVFSGLILSFTDRQKRADISHTLTRVSENFEQVIDTVMYQHNLMSGNPSLELAFYKLLLYDEFSYSDYLFLHYSCAVLSAIANSYPYIDSITLYLDGSDVLYNSDTNLCRTDSFYDADSLAIYREMPSDQNLYLVRHEVCRNSFSLPSEQISVYERLSYMNGVVIVNINAETFSQTLSSLVSDSKETVFLLNSDLSPITSGLTSSETSEEGFASEDCEAIFHELSEKASDQTVSRILLKPLNGKLKLFGISYDPDFMIYSVSVIDYSDVIWSVSPYLFGMLLFLFMYTLADLAIAYYTTKRNFVQIEYAINLLDQAEKGNTDVPSPVTEKDEYDLILNNVLRLFLQTTFLNTQLEQQKYMAEAAELKALQLQINPHFLFNTLQTLNFEAARQTHGYTTTNRIIDSLSDILKYSLGSPDSPVTLGDEITALKKYVMIQKYRFGDKITMYYDVPEELFSVPFPRLLLQPLVENSISHGIQPMEDPGFIMLEIVREDNFLNISVTDNGIGMTEEELTALKQHIADRSRSDREDDLPIRSSFAGISPSGSMSVARQTSVRASSPVHLSGLSRKNIGLTNVSRRLALNYGEDCRLQIESRKKEGTVIRFRIPV